MILVQGAGGWGVIPIHQAFLADQAVFLTLLEVFSIHLACLVLFFFSYQCQQFPISSTCLQVNKLFG